MGKLDGVTPKNDDGLYTVKIEVEGVTIAIYQMARENVERVDDIAKILSDIDVDNADFFADYNKKGDNPKHA